MTLKTAPKVIPRAVHAVISEKRNHKGDGCRRSRRSVTAGLMVALLCGVGASLPSPAAAEPPGPNSHQRSPLPPGLTQGDLERSTSISQASHKIRSLHDGRGLTAIVPDVGTGELVVHWKDAPPEVQALDGTKVDGLRVRVHSANRSQDELLAAGETLLQASRRGAVAGVSSVVGSTDGSSLTVSVTDGTLSKVGRKALARTYEDIAAMPVTVVTGEAPTPTTRQNDSNPWYGGGLIRHPGFNPPADLDPYSFCSVSFAVVTPTGAGRLLSARHCDTSGNVAWDDGAGDQLTLGGTAVSVKGTDDTMLIDPVGGTGGRVHGGSWNATSGSSRYHLKVAGSRRAVSQELVCTSGANSGEHCNLKVLDSTMRQWSCGGSTCSGFTARAVAPLISAATVGGDSGGPVYANRSDGRVEARGVIYGGSGDVGCGNIRFSVGNCFSTVFFTDIERIKTAWNVRVETTS